MAGSAVGWSVCCDCWIGVRWVRIGGDFLIVSRVGYYCFLMQSIRSIYIELDQLIQLLINQQKQISPTELLLPRRGAHHEIEVCMMTGPFLSRLHHLTPHILANSRIVFAACSWEQRVVTQIIIPLGCYLEGYSNQLLGVAEMSEAIRWADALMPEMMVQQEYVWQLIGQF